VTLEVLGQTTAVADPGGGPFNAPAFGQHNKAMQIAALDDLQPPGTGFGDSLRHCRTLVATISIDAFDEREGAMSPPRYGSGTVAILNVGGMNDDAQQQAQRIDGDMALAPFDLLARVVTRRVDRRPPFTAPLAL